jgi:hypothetical protein
MTDADVDAHNIATLWKDAEQHLDAARHALDQTVVALEDLDTTYGVEHNLDGDASRLYDAAEQLLTDLRHAAKAR